MQLLAIVNPVSGGGRGPAAAATLHKHLDAHGHDVELRQTRRPGDATRWAAETNAECVVTVGGDGTVNEVANGLALSRAALAILPVGAVNVVARQLGFKKRPRTLAERITHGAKRIMDVGLLNGNKRFLLGAGAGLDAAIVHQVHANRAGKKIGIRSYVVPTARIVLTHILPKMQVTVDGQTLSTNAEYVIVGNCRKSVGVFAGTPEAKVDDGLLDVAVLHDLNPIHVIQLVVGVCRPGFARREDVTYRQGAQIEIVAATPEPVPLQVDGDPEGFLPATFTIQHESLTVVGTS